MAAGMFVRRNPSPHPSPTCRHVLPGENQQLDRQEQETLLPIFGRVPGTPFSIRCDQASLYEVLADRTHHEEPHETREDLGLQNVLGLSADLGSLNFDRVVGHTRK